MSFEDGIIRALGGIIPIFDRYWWILVILFILVILYMIGVFAWIRI